MTIYPLNELRVDLYVDADFEGLWQVEDEQDPISVKSSLGILLHVWVFLSNGVQNFRPRLPYL